MVKFLINGSPDIKCFLSYIYRLQKLPKCVYISTLSLAVPLATDLRRCNLATINYFTQSVIDEYYSVIYSKLIFIEMYIQDFHSIQL